MTRPVVFVIPSATIELDGITTLTSQLDSDIQTVDEQRRELEKRVIAAEKSLAEAAIARQTLENARESLELRLSIAETTTESLETALFGSRSLPFGRLWQKRSRADVRSGRDYSDILGPVVAPLLQLPLCP